MPIVKRLVWLVLLVPVFILDIFVWVGTGRKFYLTEILDDWVEDDI